MDSAKLTDFATLPHQLVGSRAPAPTDAVGAQGCSASGAIYCNGCGSL